PEDRYPSARALADALAAWRSSRPHAPPVVAPSLADEETATQEVIRVSPARTSRRRFLLAGAATSIVALVVGIALLIAHLVKPPPPPPPGPSVLDKLKPEDIPASERFEGQPKELIAVLGESRWRHWRDISGLAFSPDGKLLVSSGADGAVRVWELPNGK